MDVNHWGFLMCSLETRTRPRKGEGRRVGIRAREVSSEGYRILLLSCSSQYRGFIKKTNTDIYDNFFTFKLFDGGLLKVELQAQGVGQNT